MSAIGEFFVDLARGLGQFLLITLAIPLIAYLLFGGIAIVFVPEDAPTLLRGIAWFFTGAWWVGFLWMMGRE